MSSEGGLTRWEDPCHSKRSACHAWLSPGMISIGWQCDSLACFVSAADPARRFRVGLVSKTCLYLHYFMVPSVVPTGGLWAGTRTTSWARLRDFHRPSLGQCLNRVIPTRSSKSISPSCLGKAGNVRLIFMKRPQSHAELRSLRSFARKREFGQERKELGSLLKHSDAQSRSFFTRP